MKNLVMGSGRGYSWYIFEPFVRSFLQNVPDAELVLFVDEISDFTHNMIKSNGGGRIKLEPFPKDFNIESPINARWKTFLDYLEAHGDEYAQVLISDTRDVIFQGDVFSRLADKKNYIGYATEGANIGEDGINTKWLISQFGQAEAEKLANKKIICGGTVIGTPNEMKIFLSTMWKSIQDVRSGSIDQGIYNYLVYNKLMPIENLVEIDCWSGEILTAQLFHERNPIRLNGNLILRGDGNIPAVVHQYDRQPLTAMLVNSVYRAKDFQPDYQLTDTRNALEQIPHLVRSGNLEDALKFFVNYVLGKTDFDGQYDMLIDTWGNILEEETPTRPFKEMLELALQYAMEAALSKKFLLLSLKRLTPHLERALKTNRPLSMEFKIFVANGLFSFANMFFNGGNYRASKAYLDFITALNIPLGPAFFNFQMQVQGRLSTGGYHI